MEPLTVITGGHNHKDQLTYAWKTLFYKMRRMIVSVAVAWTRFTVRWKHVLPRSTKSETLLRPIFSTSGRAKSQPAKAQSDYLFTVINTGLHDKVDTVSTVIDVGDL